MILTTIIERTKVRVEQQKLQHSFEELKEKAVKNISKDSRFVVEETLKTKGLHFICEVKKASPSKGIFVENFNYVAIAKEYEQMGASMISVLTEPTFFQGSDEYLVKIKQTVSTPILRKDFIVDAYQLYESKCLGADCVLLIASVLEKERLREYLSICDELHLSALVETRNEEEIMAAMEVGARIIGVNNRNLEDFSEQLSTSVKLRKKVPDSIIFVSESGIRTKEDMKVLYDAGVQTVLIGEVLMKSENKTQCLAQLTSLCSEEESV